MEDGAFHWGRWTGRVDGPVAARNGTTAATCLPTVIGPANAESMRRDMEILLARIRDVVARYRLETRRVCDDGDSDDGDNADYIVGGDCIDGLGKRMAKERLRRSGLLNLHILIPSRLVYSHRGYPSLLVRRKRMMPNRGLMLVGYRTTVDMT